MPPFNGSGLFNVYTPGNPVVTGTVISSAVNNNTNSDFATGLSTAITKDGQTTVTANIPFSNFRLTGIGAATALTDAARANQVQNSSLTYLTGVAGVDTITANASVTPSAYAAGQSFQFVSAGANTGAVTLNVSGLGAKAVTKNGTVALVAGDIPASSTVSVTYDGTQFQLSSSIGIKESIIDAKGDLIVGTAADTAGRLAVGSNGTIPMARSAATSGLAYVAALNGAIYGLTYANGTDATNDINIAAGGAMDATGAYWMTLSAITKQLDVNWAVGTNAGGLDTGAVGNNDYYIWLIARSDTGVVDALFSLSSTAPTMPANYDYKRLIGWLRRSAGANLALLTYEMSGGGLHYMWKTPILDISLAATLTTSRRTDRVSTPAFVTDAEIQIHMYDAASGAAVYISNPDSTDQAPSTSASPGSTVGNVSGARAYGKFEITTNASGQICSRADIATVDEYQVSTLGFKWSRR